MIGTRSVLLATSLLLAAPAMAAQPEGGRYVYVPPGATIVLLPAAAPTVPVDFPVARMVAQQQAMMQQMMANMDALMATPMPDPEQMIRSVMDGMPQTLAGSGVVLTQMTSGAGTCSETIVYGPQGVDGLPQVKLTLDWQRLRSGHLERTHWRDADRTGAADGSAGNRNLAREPPVARQLSGAASGDTHRIAADVTELPRR